MPRELEELKQEYAEGRLDGIKECLELFIRRYKEPIKKFSEQHKLSIDLGLRCYIILGRTIDTRKENLDQLEEIKKELWYRREEKSDLPESAIIKDWTEKHAAGWRDHRVMQIIYVYLQDKERYLALLP